MRNLAEKSNATSVEFLAIVAVSIDRRFHATTRGHYTDYSHTWRSGSDAAAIPPTRSPTD